MKNQTTDKTLEYYMSLPYTIELTPDEEGFWFARIPLLKGCMTNGSNAGDAVEMIIDAKRGWLITAMELGLPIPEPETGDKSERDTGVKKIHKPESPN